MSSNEEKATRSTACTVLVANVVWIGFFAHELAYINQNFQAPAGKNAAGFQNCFYSTTTGLAGPDQNVGSFVNVSDEFSVMIKIGLAFFCVNAFGGLI